MHGNVVSSVELICNAVHASMQWRLFLRVCLCVFSCGVRSDCSTSNWCVSPCFYSLHCTLAAAQCIVIGPVFGWVCVFVGLLPRKLEIACIDPHQTGFVDKGSDHFQLIKFWPYHASGKGVCDGPKIFLICLTTASAQYLCLQWALFHYVSLLCSYDTNTRFSGRYSSSTWGQFQNVRVS